MVDFDTLVVNNAYIDSLKSQAEERSDVPPLASLGGIALHVAAWVPDGCAALVQNGKVVGMIGKEPRESSA